MLQAQRQLFWYLRTSRQDVDKLPASVQFLPDTKKREPDQFIRLTHIETLLLLCTTRPAREFMRLNGVYEVVQKMHETEQNTSVNALVSAFRFTNQCRLR
jgi:hypothetical protein